MSFRKNIAAAVVSGLFIISFAVNLFLWWKVGDLSNYSFEGQHAQYPYLDPAQGFYSDTDLLVNMGPLRDKLQELTQGEKVSIYFEFLNTGANVGVNPTMPFYPGSLMKIPVAMAVMKNIDSGKWTLDDKLILTDTDKNENYGGMWRLPSGSTFTIRELLARLLVDSDDTARQIFLRNLGPAEINGVLDYLGLQDIFNEKLEIGAQQYSRLFRALYKSGFLSAASSEYLLDVLNVPHDAEWLRAGIPENVSFSHKIGVYGDIHSDSGIAYPPNRSYILTTMVEDANADKAAALMQTISKTVYDYVTLQ